MIYLSQHIGIVILNYNSYQDTIDLLKNLQQQSLFDVFNIVVVDNASPNNSFNILKSLEKKLNNVVVLQAGSNLGYAKGNNFGLKYLEKQFNPHYVAILNNDIQLPHNCFEKLIEKHDLLENPAIIAPKQLDINNKDQQPYKLNSFLDDCLNLFMVFKIFHKRNALTYVDNTGLDAMKTTMIPGSFMFSALETFKRMGYFYPNTFLFAEERFIAVKAKQLKLNNYILLDISYVHHHSKTINSVYTQLSKFKFLYKSLIEFTKVCRRNGKIKAMILKVLMQLSLLEMRLYYGLKNFFK